MPRRKQDWYARGLSKNGALLKSNRPKARLTASQAKVLSLFYKNSDEKAMLDVLTEYIADWPADGFTTAKMSRDLKELRQDGFLDAKKAIPVRTSKHERSYAYKPHKKSIFSLSDAAKSGALVIDGDRWVTVNGVYVAPAHARQSKTNRSFYTLPVSKNKRLLRE